MKNDENAEKDKTGQLDSAIVDFDVYIAAPGFSNAQRDWNRRLASYLAERGLSVFPPQNKCISSTNPQVTYNICNLGLLTSRTVVAVLDGSDAESGTCFKQAMQKVWVKRLSGYDDCRKSVDFNVSGILNYGVDRLVQELSGDDTAYFSNGTQQCNGPLLMENRDKSMAAKGISYLQEEETCRSK